MKEILQNLFASEIDLNENLITKKKSSSQEELNQNQTKDIFSDKWTDVEKYEDVERLYEFQTEWF